MEKNLFKNEKWQKIILKNAKGLPKLEISNAGRFKSYRHDPDDGTLMKGSVISGYPVINIKLNKDTIYSKYIHRLVAEYFVKKKSPKHKFLIHLDYDKSNNNFKNLKWVTKEEYVAHHNENPNVVKSRRKGVKLTEQKVKMIKKLLLNKNTKLYLIARKFNISHTHLNRIRSKENWAHVE